MNMKNLRSQTRDYSTSDVDYQNYDPARDLSHLMPGAEFEHVLLNKLTIYKQLKELKKRTSTFCEPLRRIPRMECSRSVDVIYFVGCCDLPFTAPPRCCTTRRRIS